MATARSTAVVGTLAGPTARLARRVGGWPGAALLEGGPGFGEAGRWSILAALPRWTFEATGPAWAVLDGRGRAIEAGSGDPLAVLADRLDLHRLADPNDEPEPGSPPFQGGLIGSIGYDLAPSLERLPRKAPRDSCWPDLRFGFHDTAVLVDHRLDRAELWAVDLLDEGHAAVQRRWQSWRDRLELLGPGPLAAGPVEIVPRTTRAEYLEAVRRAIEYVHAGDVFQVNLAQRFEARGRFNPLDLHRRLRRTSPAPFACLLRRGDSAVIGSSPELFYRTAGDRIVTRPIKGTRPRGVDPAEDDRLRAELVGSAKDRAELTMIVDLQRNDLGRVCRYESVRVAEARAVESYAQVHHLVATVEGRLRPTVGPIDVVRAMFPGGSITGAPKIRAMEIIDELEPTRRGVYTGAIGYFGAGGSSAFNIAIRTLVVEGQQAWYHVGGGIVVDSVPEAEYQETLDKGRGLSAVLGGS